jgi:hypothetical protein
MDSNNLIPVSQREIRTRRREAAKESLVSGRFPRMESFTKGWVRSELQTPPLFAASRLRVRTPIHLNCIVTAQRGRVTDSRR